MKEYMLSFGSERVPIVKKGTGSRKLLVIGPASLFTKDGMLPNELFDMYTVYFADIFSNKNAKIKGSEDFGYFVNLIESIRSQLALEKPDVFAHSAMGVLGYEYARQFSKQISNLILVSTAPIWDKDFRAKESQLFFKGNASDSKKLLYLEDQAQKDRLQQSQFFAASQTADAARAKSVNKRLRSQVTETDENQNFLSYKNRPVQVFIADSVPTKTIVPVQASLRYAAVALSELMQGWQIGFTEGFASFVLEYLARRAHFLFDAGSGFLVNMWSGVRFDTDRVGAYFNAISDYSFLDVEMPAVPVFLALGLHDASVPFYIWTEEGKSHFSKMTSYLFPQSGHYPMIEEAKSFVQQLRLFIDNPAQLSKETNQSFHEKNRISSVSY